MCSASTPILHDSWQSSAAWRVRAGLRLKGIDHATRMHEIIGKPHRTPAFMALNPQGTVPVLEIDGLTIPQSLAILEYIEETRDGPRLLPKDAAARARVRMLSHIIAMETHVVTNMDVARDASGGGDVTEWMHRYLRRGLDAFEVQLDHPDMGAFGYGDTPSMVDCCLVPQARNAQRAGLEISNWPRIADIQARCLKHPAFSETHPDRGAPAEVKGESGR
ncbi:MAG: maleylacetoacetate isomerase [Sulfitobacter sp.]|uniref:maleylacetoacetate isomerase n=1 Tax=Alphaproteobacteria TaxID=28211 RepID=UPI002941F649|nr:maleylacetoacetate isomerase [Sulfitobacter sp. LC.270.F.C4]WOI15274.1 maleylacetoacetate isomerase [Sulfitobacter sp. LC.270.F.C4]